ncbi:hypothetical protein EA462_17020 [Natrarchaeobius halalkaliphilus]|uniref:Fido domain-containing protein n=1 Tax=Natrarchaeobius halalkaliphilus TaxID=1679091 RepID=A0A3N6NYN5_9EURY|nr:hypothetical protein [Natrarchaeobius halalkaliphilus]RQG86172.1 hypothetical protein EA462_17020 [Natrarchaeobius halalkaliphilus]
MGHVYYHHPGDKQFSLDYITQTPEEVVSQITSYRDDVSVKVSEYDLDEHFYAIYTSRGGGKPVSELELDVSEALEQLEAENGQIVARLLETYRALIQRNEEEEGSPVIAYKDPDIEALGEVLDRVSWTGSATDVAGRLSSNLILKHALPNANHRAAVAVIQVYLRCYDPDFSLPETKGEAGPNEFDWQDWVNAYINESKRILTVRRKNVIFKILRQFGATTVERKHNVEIDLTSYTLDLYPSEAKKRYAEEHEQLWISFVEEVVERVERSDLKDTPALSKSAFAEEIRNLD